MANLKDLRTRISSIKSTQKITKAMKMVAAAKVKRSEHATKATRPFTNALKTMFFRLVAANSEKSFENCIYENNINNFPALLKRREVKTVALLVLTSNKGLAGAYNANLVRTAIAKVEEYKSRNINCRMFVVGSKGVAALKRRAKIHGFEIAKTYTSFPQEISFGMSQQVANDLADEYVNGVVDKVEIVTTTFKNMMSYNVQSWEILPIENQGPNINDNVPEALMEFEPSVDEILKTLMPMYFSNLIYQAFLEATASELASRMMAMSAASDNAQEMIDSLTVEYNKVRQFAITQELIEIVGGAGALKK